MNEPERIRRALEDAETIAVVGCSPDPSRASHAITRYLLSQGYRVVPVNPHHGEILGERCYAAISEIPTDVRIDIVDVFRRPEHVAGIADEAIRRSVPFVFLQLGVVDPDSARRLEEKEIGVAMDRCILVEHGRLGLPPKSRNAPGKGPVPFMSRQGTS